MSTSVVIAEKIRALSASIPAGQALGVKQAAVVLEVSVAAMSSSVRRKKLVATRTVFTAVPVPTAVVKMTSRMAHLLDHDTKVHDIGPRKKSVLVINGQPISGTVSHPGTRGKRMWENGVLVALPKMKQVYQAAIIGQVRKGW